MDPNPLADRADVERELGDFDDLTVDRILALGPRVADLVEVRMRLTQEDVLDEELREPSTVVAETLALVRSVLGRLEEEEREEESAA